MTDSCLLWASRPVQLVHQAISLENLLIVFLSMGSRSTLSRCGKFWPYRDLATFDLVQMWQLLFQFLLHLCCLWNSLLQVSENTNWQWLVLRETYSWCKSLTWIQLWVVDGQKSYLFVMFQCVLISFSASSARTSMSFLKTWKGKVKLIQKKKWKWMLSTSESDTKAKWKVKVIHKWKWYKSESDATVKHSNRMLQKKEN